MKAFIYCMKIVLKQGSNDSHAIGHLTAWLVLLVSEAGLAVQIAACTRTVAEGLSAGHIAV